MFIINRKFNKEMKWGLVIFGLYLCWSFLWLFYSRVVNGTLANPYTPQIDITKELAGPFTEGHLLGTDIFGRSLFEIVSSGLIYSLSVAFSVSFLCVSIGISIGYLTAKKGGAVRVVLDSLTNLIFVFPSILIAIMIMSVVGQSFWGLVFALVVTGWPAYARIARGEVLRILALPYVESSKAVGMGEFRLFFKVVLPALVPVMIIHLVLGLGGVIISEAALGFLGLGGSEYSWGALLSVAKSVLLEAPYMAIIISTVMAGLIVGLNLCGDGLRDYFDPHQD